MSENNQQNETAIMTKLHYHFYGSDLSVFNLDFNQSDFGHHETILNALIGNLVKLKSDSTYIPYLASEYQISENNLTYTFKMRENLTCDNGFTITAQEFTHCLTKNILNFAKTKNALEFDKLEGFDESLIHNLNHISGLHFENDLVILKFKTKPENLLELLKMPYFGYWPIENFNQPWSSTTKFVSSGAYSLSKDSTHQKIILNKRGNWFSVKNETLHTLIFEHSSLSNLHKLSLKPLIIESNSRNEIQHQNIDINFKKIIAEPTHVSTLVLNPYKKPFSDLNIRKLLRSNLFESNALLANNFFYKSAQSQIIQDNFDLQKTINYSEKYNIKLGHFFTEMNDLVLKVKKQIEANEKNKIFNIEYIGNYHHQNDWYEQLMSYETFDIRFSSVANGRYPRNFIINMIFCSDLGVRYPDPSGRIRDLVLSYHQDWQEKPLPQDYINELNQILYDDACVIPISHFGPQWFLSSYIDTDYFPETMDVPLFEELRVKTNDS